MIIAIHTDRIEILKKDDSGEYITYQIIPNVDGIKKAKFTRDLMNLFLWRTGAGTVLQNYKKNVIQDQYEYVETLTQIVGDITDL